MVPDQTDGYDSVVSQVARGLCSVPGRTDELAYDREDHESDLRMVAWGAQSAFQDQFGFSTPSERRYVCKAVWNAGRSARRLRQFRRDRETGTMYPPPVQAWELLRRDDGQRMAREALTTLRGVLGQDFEVLLRVGASEGCVAKAYVPADGPRRTWRRRVQNLRARAKAILDISTSGKDTRHG